jgi:uncharacterized repeat protein (TIGR01451 family)
MVLSHVQHSRFALRLAAFATILLLVATGVSASQSHPQLAPSAILQMRTLESVKMSKTQVQNKIDSRLYLGLLKLRNDSRLAALTSFRFVKPELDGRVPVDIILANKGAMKSVLLAIEASGGVVRGKSALFQRISARVKLQDLETLAAISGVRKIRQAIPYIKGGYNKAAGLSSDVKRKIANLINTSEGDATHGAANARGIYGVNGTGVKVGVISDGVDSLATLQASGDLPPACPASPCSEFLPGQAGSGDEGTAMMEIIHDLAPGASITFATADPDETQFAQNILDLAAAGCNIIVDDIIYLDESPFEDSGVAQAVNTVTAGGVLYFSSAGNEGNKNDGTSGTWEGDFLASAAADPGPLAGANLHDFGDGGNSILVPAAGGSNTPPLMIWAEHYDLITGLASTDFDLYDMDGGLTTIFDASTDVQDGVGGDDFPIEFIGGGVFSGERLLIDKFAAGATSSVPMINLIAFRAVLSNTTSTPGATRGHSAAAAAFSVAATPAAAPFGATPPGPYPGLFTAANASESFTSDGTRRIILDGVTGSELTPGNRTSTGGIVRQKPDITAADGVSCAAPGFSTFYGTSAAAPHAAAIAALMKSAVPAATPAAIRTALINSAIDIDGVGVDRDTGAGIVMAPAALANIGAVAQAFLSASAPVPTQAIGDGDAFIESNEAWNLTIQLTNTGGQPATGINAILSSSTPGVTVPANASAYPNLAPSASGNNVTPFTFIVGPTVPCGATLNFTLTVTYTGGGSPQMFNFSFLNGEPAAPQTFSYVGPVVPIPDAADLSGTNPGAVANAVLAVAGVPGNAIDVNFRFDGTACSNAAGLATAGLDHTFVSDLHIDLTSPSATDVQIMNEPDGSGNNFCQTVLDDESPGGSIQVQPSGGAPFSNTFKPNAPLSAFDTTNPNGNWTLGVQDFFSGDTGNIRAWSLVITGVICNAPPLTANVNGTKTVAGTFHKGTNVTYTVTLTNSGGLAQADNAGNEFIDILPASLTLVSANASSGAAVATIGTNTVTWNGALGPINGSVTITIVATINNVAPATVVSNQGTINYDADGNGSNESSRQTDDPGVGGASDPTNFTVTGATFTATKTKSGSSASGGAMSYTVTINNTGNAATADNAGNEFTDVLPAGLTLVSASASSGAAVATVGTNTVTWNGGIPAAGSVTITINATINAANGATVTNQGSVSYDSDINGTNETTIQTDDPGVGGAADPTSFVVTGPTLSANKTANGPFLAGSNMTYTITISNSGNAAAPDNAGNEFTDVLPAQLTLVSANASSGAAVATIGTNTVTWNGSVPAAGSVTITITATINAGAAGQLVSNQGSVSYDADLNGTNETTIQTNDPNTPAPNDPTVFLAVSPIPALSTIALMLLALGLAVVAMRARLT